MTPNDSRMDLSLAGVHRLEQERAGDSAEVYDLLEVQQGLPVQLA